MFIESIRVIITKTYDYTVTVVVCYSTSLDYYGPSLHYGVIITKAYDYNTITVVVCYSISLDYYSPSLHYGVIITKAYDYNIITVVVCYSIPLIIMVHHYTMVLL